MKTKKELKKRWVWMWGIPIVMGIFIFLLSSYFAGGFFCERGKGSKECNIDADCVPKEGCSPGCWGKDGLPKEPVCRLWPKGPVTVRLVCGWHAPNSCSCVNGQCKES